MSYFVKYDLVTGEFRGAGEAPREMLPKQVVDVDGQPNGLGVIELGRPGVVPETQPNGATHLVFDQQPVREALHLRIDEAAGLVRRRYITDVPGQAQTYERKEREARSNSNDPAEVPFLDAEAQLRSVPIEQVRQEVMAQVEALIPLAAAIEAHRIHAKLSVTAMQNIRDMVAAANVDWEQVIADHMAPSD
jgi:hypothetical protein